jgi:hypothetical protein
VIINVFAVIVKFEFNAFVDVDCDSHIAPAFFILKNYFEADILILPCKTPSGILSVHAESGTGSSEMRSSITNGM